MLSANHRREARLLRFVQTQSDDQRFAQAGSGRRVEPSAMPAEGRLGKGEEVVAVDDALARHPMALIERDFRSQASDRPGDPSQGHVREQWNCAIASQQHAGPASAELDVIDVESVQRGSPPSASCHAANSSRPCFPIHSSCGYLP
jgi:hypothetical protein